jgi:hypothetical protein
VTVAEWNAKHPVGTWVDFRDASNRFSARTESEAWELGDGTPFVLIAGKSGCVGLSFLTVSPTCAQCKAPIHRGTEIVSGTCHSCERDNREERYGE